MLAKAVHRKYTEEVEGAEGRVGLDEYEDLKKIVLKRILGNLQPELRARLMTVLVIPESYLTSESPDNETETETETN